MRVFIGYSSKEKALAHLLVQALTKHGHIVWNNEQILPGEQWFQKIKSAVEDCEVFIPIFSQETKDSLYLSMEISLAVASRIAGEPKIIVPVRATPNATPPFFLQDIQWADFSNPAHFDENVKQVLSALKIKPETQKKYIDAIATREKMLDFGQRFLNEQIKASEARRSAVTKMMTLSFAITMLLTLLGGIVFFTSNFLDISKKHQLAFLAACVLSQIGSITAFLFKSVRILDKTSRENDRQNSLYWTQKMPLEK
jgi:TIR domain